MRPLSILRMLLPAGLALVALKFAIDDLAVPRATTELRLWGIGEYRQLQRRPGGRISTGCAPATTSSACRPTPRRWGGCSDITIFRRGDDGILTERLQAESATPLPDGWRLRAGHPGAGRRPRRRSAAELDWPGADRHRPDPAAGPSAARARARPAAGDRRRRRLWAAGARALPDLAASADRRRLRADVPDDAGLRAGPPLQPYRLDRPGVHDRGRDRLHAADL